MMKLPFKKFEAFCIDLIHSSLLKSVCLFYRYLELKLKTWKITVLGNLMPQKLFLLCFFHCWSTAEWTYLTWACQKSKFYNLKQKKKLLANVVRFERVFFFANYNTFDIENVIGWIHFIFGTGFVVVA